MLRKVVGAAKDPSWGKLRPNWEGPFWITSVTGIGAYYLEDLDEKVVPRPEDVLLLTKTLLQFKFLVCHGYASYIIFFLKRVLDRIKVLHGLRTQTYRETSYFQEKTKY